MCAKCEDCKVKKAIAYHETVNVCDRCYYLRHAEFKSKEEAVKRHRKKLRRMRGK